MFGARVTAETVDGVTRLTAESDMGRSEKRAANILLSIFSGFAVVFGILSAVQGRAEPVLTAGLVFVTALAIYATLRFSATHRARTQPRQLDAALDQITALVSTVAPAEAPIAPLRDAFDASADAALDSVAAPRRRDRA